ncbi:MAG: ZPR1 zinc finger domain-containing protein [Candidatus Thorarchaeota archaeon]
MTQEEDLAVYCPSCEEGKLLITSQIYSIPFFNELAMFSMECPNCNFKHNDVFSAEQRKPSRWTLTVDDPSLLSIRVVRSGSGTIRFPEFGIDVEPGPAAESFISNVEGVLYRTRSVVESAVNFADTEEQRQRGKELLEVMQRAIKGEFTFTLILEDPSGVSGIIPDDMRLVKYEELTADEASELKGAPIWVDNIREEVSEHKG